MPETSLGDRLIRRWEALRDKRKNTETVWQDIADNLIGRRDFLTRRTPGDNTRTRFVYDDTSKVSGALLAGAMHSLLTNPSTRWFELAFENTALMRNEMARTWLFDTQRHLQNVIERPEANFHAQLSESYYDLIYFGTTGFFIEDKAGFGPRFSTRPLAELFMAEDPGGIIDTVFRKFMLTARQAFDMWGRADETASRLVEKTPEVELPYIHAIFPREDVVVGNVDQSGMAWQSVIVAVETRTALSIGGFQELPMAIARWSKDAGEVYGRGPGWEALSDQRTLNEMKRTTLVAGEKIVDPPLLVDSDGVLPSTLRMFPGGVTPVDVTSSLLNPPIQPLPIDMSGWPITAQMISETRQQVQDAFHHQLIELIRDPRMTATQVLELSAQVQRHMAPILGRIQTELLEPIIERVFEIEVRAGRISDFPDILGGEVIKVNYVSPVSRAQKANDARAIIDFSTVVANLSQADPSVMDLYDGDAAVRELADAMGVPPSVVRMEEEVAKRREAQAALAEQQAQLDQAQQVAQTAGQAAPALRAIQGGQQGG